MIKNLMTILGAALLLPVTAMAITERDLVGAGFPPVQAETLWDLVQQGPADDLAIGGDAITFAAAGTIASTGSGTDLTVSPVDTFIVKAAQDANRQWIFSAASDTALNLLIGDATAAQQILIGAGTADAADSDVICITGGGACDSAGATRGGVLSINGNEATGAGDVILLSGDAAGSVMSIGTVAASGTLQMFSGAGVPHLTLASSSTTVLPANFGAAATSTQSFDLKSASADAADNDRLTLSGGGSFTTSRGAFITLNGNEFTGAGDTEYFAGAASGSDMTIGAAASNGTFTLYAGGAIGMTMASTLATVFSGAVTSTATGSLGWSVVDGADGTACTAQCTGAAVFGFDLAGGATAPVLVDAANTGADICVCASAS